MLSRGGAWTSFYRYWSLQLSNHLPFFCRLVAITKSYLYKQHSASSQPQVRRCQSSLAPWEDSDLPPMALWGREYYGLKIGQLRLQALCTDVTWIDRNVWAGVGAVNIESTQENRA